MERAKKADLLSKHNPKARDLEDDDLKSTSNHIGRTQTFMKTMDAQKYVPKKDIEFKSSGAIYQIFVLGL